LNARCVCGQSDERLTPSVPADPDRARIDRENEEWKRRLAPRGRGREQASTELRQMLLRGARSEANRRRGSLPDPVLAEVDDLCEQAADDALAGVLSKLDDFRGDSRFTTWAYKFAIFEISTRLRRHAWRGRRVELDEAAWDRLGSRTDEVAAAADRRSVLRLIKEGAEQSLTERQRLVFDAAVLQEVPIDVLAERLGTTRGAVYKVLHDARSKLRRHVEASGYGEYLP
jgi:RNA polymerase sigma-70 factor, ECF subfamily